MFLPLIIVGDCVLVKVEKSPKPDVGLVTKIFEVENGRVYFRVKWYMWPDDTEQGKLTFQGNNEILSTDWLTDVDPETIDGKCTVHEINAYQCLTVAGPEDFICRTKYYPKQRSYLRQELPVYV